MITVLVADDHSYIRKGIGDLLEASPDIKVLATAANGIEAVAKARSLQPDVVIIDISMPFMGGIEATKQIRENHPPTHVLALSIYDNPDYIESALQAGATGYILKDAIPNELIEAIYALYRGGRYFSQKIAHVIDPYSEEDNDSRIG
jgi:DNA-binding NarL/FixJ family response regulator